MVKVQQRILMVHNYYGSEAPSGENVVFGLERDMLRRRGHEVAELTRHSDEIRTKGLPGVIRGALVTPWNPYMIRELRRIVESFRPDVVHVHNTFPLISPAIFHAIGSCSACVLTLHNYRLFCPAAIPMRAGRVCTDCLDHRSVWPALQYGCYRSSRLATLPLAVSVAMHRRLGTWRRQVDAFIALTAFQRERLVAAGLASERVQVKPNFYPGSPRVIPWRARAPRVVFAGRLTTEKGLTTLVRAWLAWGNTAPELRIIGDGCQRVELERIARDDTRVPIRFLGQLTAEATQAEIANARLLVLPSESFEGFPMVVREAFAFGTPPAVSNLGPLPSIVQTGESGLVFEASNPLGLLKVVREAWHTPGLLEHLSLGARAEFEYKYTEDANYGILIGIYRSALETLRNR